jgi:hypothetical protein
MEYRINLFFHKKLYFTKYVYGHMGLYFTESISSSIFAYVLHGKNVLSEFFLFQISDQGAS